MAIAPQRSEIGIRRHFTTEGVHPYDEVRWERRDARITNYRDGAVAFEQLGVEVPESWSLNATNILAQKYFRGTLGTPERETSLRQVADRVVDTLTMWGIKDGYFVDDEEAQTFNHELKYLIIHQKAAFNSPVWFNIGVHGVPQQGSACQPYHSLVSTPDGLVPIGQLVEDDAVGAKVFDAEGITRIVATKHNGQKPVLRIHTKAGHQLDVTGDHLVWRATSATTGAFVQAADLRPDDKLSWHRTDGHGPSQIAHSSVEVAEAALAGWLQSDGFVGQYEGTNRSLTIEAMTVTDAEHRWVTEALNEVFPGVHRHQRHVDTVDTSLDCRRTRLYGRELNEFVERWDLRTRGLAMTVPPQLFTAPLPVVRAYLRSIFQAEGYVSVKERGAVVAVDMISEGLVRGLQALLTQVGIFSRVRFKADSRPDRKGCWSLSIRTRGDRITFANEVGFIDPKKENKLYESIELDGLAAHAVKRLEIERIEDLGEMDVYDIQTESGEYLSANLRVHNCFILSVEDTMDSILNWYTEEGIIFKGGSGAGVNLSRIRSSHELLKGGGTASGPVSFMRGADASAGTIKSGGKTRRAAKMVILDADHPDIEDFIWCKAIEERKARVLRDAGFDMDLDGADSHSTQYQNANNSVRVTDEFMEAVLDGRDWNLTARTDGSIVRTVPARDLFRQIAHSAWECADPGLQYDTTINRWHTAPNTGRINGSNPCFPGSAKVHTDKGLIPFRELFERANQGETFGIYTHDATNPDAPSEQMLVTSPDAFMITGYNDIVRLRLDNGVEIRCTPSHKIFTTNRGYVEARKLTFADEVKLLDLEAPAVEADLVLPVSSDPDDYWTKGDHAQPLRFPETWSEEFAHYLGWLVGDGSTSGSTVASIYGSQEDRDEILPRHAELLDWVNCERPIKLSEQANGTAQLRLARRAFKQFIEALGFKSVKGPEKTVPWSIEQAPAETVAAFLRGLYDADGCVVSSTKQRYVGLGSTSPELLKGVQTLLSTFGIMSRLYQTKGAKSEGSSSYVNRFGETKSYGRSASYDLRISSGSIIRFAEHIGFSLSRKAAILRSIVIDAPKGPYAARTTAHLLERTNEGVELTYNLTEPRNHSYVVNGVVVRNCSEYVHLDNSACNLASMNLLTFLNDSDEFDVEGFKAAVSVVFTGMEIIVGNADYPTESIGETTRAFRQLGIGYANLGALLMAEGLPYDSDAGRAWAAAITALLTGHAYATSARTAARMGPFAGFHENGEAMLNVLRMHQAEAARIDEDVVPPELLSAAQESWDAAVELAEVYGVRNSQASVLAPTGCLVGGTLVSTGRGLVRLGSLGDPDGPQWQDLETQVATDDGPQQATKFYVNGSETVVAVDTARGHQVKGTPTHRIKVVDPASGEWMWRRFGDLVGGELVPLALGALVGEPQTVALPPLAEAYWTGEHHVQVPRQMTPELAELVGYFMGDGSLHSRGLRFCVTESDFDVVERLQLLSKECFGTAAKVTPKRGYVEVRVDSVRLALWWEACGFAKRPPVEGHRGKGYTAHIPDAVLHANDPEVYGAFLRGLYEADGDTSAGYPHLKNTSLQLVRDAQTMLLALGIPTTLSVRDRTGENCWGTAPLATLRTLNVSYSASWLEAVGFISDRKNAGVHVPDSAEAQTARKDYVPLTRDLIDRLAPGNDRMRKVLLMEQARGRVSRRIATELFERTGDPKLAHLLAFFYDTVDSVQLGDDELTYDLSVPSNVTYVANGFVSHNTIGLLMDCDTTGVEPDLGLVKTKKLVGGGTMSIVNQTVPRALAKLGYGPEQAEDIVAYVNEHMSIVGTPHLAPEHMAIFACSMGDNTIHYSGHIRMMGAVQPFISGAISKTVNMPEDVTVEDVEQLHIDAWRLGIKAVAIYRDNCKVAQPLSTTKKEVAAVGSGEGGDMAPAGSAAEAHDREIAAHIAELEAALAKEQQRTSSPLMVGAVRERLPRKRNSKTFSFRVADCEGYVTVGEYEDGRPGEVFIKVSKQGSTLAGIMDAFSISLSLGLQHGVPLATFVRKFANMKFEPAGITDDPELRIATSLIDYISRRLALDFLSVEERTELGIFSTQERMQPTLPGVEEMATPSTALIDDGLSSGSGDGAGAPAAYGTTAQPMARAEQLDAPLCYNCGNTMQRAGSCYVCGSCGSTSGCS
jgi:ribonucleoside-diphosphate reductase alpha chain